MLLFKDEEIPLTNILAWVTDGTHSMTGATVGALLSWRRKKKQCPMSLPFRVSFITNIWLQKTSVITCTSHNTLPLLHWVKLKSMLSMICYYGRIMNILKVCRFILKFVGYQKATVWDTFMVFLLWSFLKTQVHCSVMNSKKSGMTENYL